MFREIISPILRSTRLCLHLVVQCTDDAAGRQYRRCIIPQAVNTVYAPEDGWIYRPKHVELVGIINKLLLLNLVCVYIICTVVLFKNTKNIYYAQYMRFISIDTFG